MEVSQDPPFLSTFITILRHDGNLPKERGDFSCLVDDCGWKIRNADSSTAYKHAKEVHDASARVEREVKVPRKRRKSEQEIKESHRVGSQRYRDRHKISKEVGLISGLVQPPVSLPVLF